MVDVEASRVESSRARRPNYTGLSHLIRACVDACICARSRQVDDSIPTSQLYRALSPRIERDHLTEKKKNYSFDSSLYLHTTSSYIISQY